MKLIRKSMHLLEGRRKASGGGTWQRRNSYVGLWDLPGEDQDVATPQHELRQRGVELRFLSCS